jgi:hypothetical protein
MLFCVAGFIVPGRRRRSLSFFWVFLLDCCSRECIVLFYCFCCPSLFGCIALGYNLVTVLVYVSGGLICFGLFKCSEVLILLFWVIQVCCFGLFGLFFRFAVLSLFGYCSIFVWIIVVALFTDAMV